MDSTLLQQMIDAGLVDDQAQILAQQIKRGQGLMQTPGAQGMNVGGTYRASSPLEHLSTALSRVMGGRMVDQAESGLDQGIGTKRAGRMAFAEGGAPPMLGALSGDPAMAAAGQASATEAQRATQAALEGRRIDQSAAAQAAEAQARATAQAEAARHNRATESLTRGSMEQDAWSAIADPVTGGVVAYNKKTGEVRPLGPGGGRPGPGSVPPKPKDLENDVQSLGKDLEPIQKATPDIEALRSAANKGDVAGFGPVAGRLPNIVTSAEGVANRQAAGRLMASIIQATSGQAASEKEVDRLLEANGMGRTATDDQIKQGVAKLEGQYQALLKQREAKYHPDVVETYRSRGGYTMPNSAAPAAGGPVQVRSVEEARALPPGTRFLDPNGVERVR